MNDPIHHPAQAPSSGSSKTLWAATLVLVVAVLAMGAALIRIQSQPVEPRMAVLPQPAPAASTSPPATDATSATPETSGVASAAGGAAMASSAVPISPKNLEQNQHQALTNQAQEAINNAANQPIEITAKPRPVLPRQPEPAVLKPPALGTTHTAPPEPLQPLPR